jgi:hypothetical protein
MITDELLQIAHKGMAIGPSPFLQYQKTAKYQYREGVAFTRQDLEGPGFNCAAVVGPAPPLARVLELCRPFFEGCPGGYGILVEADAGHPVEAEMRKRFWPIAEDEPALVLPALPASFTCPAGLEIRRISDAHGLAVLRATLGKGFEAGGELGNPLWPGSCAEDPDMAFFIGYCDREPVTTAVFGRIDRIATVHGISTVPAYRRRGFGRAITWAAANAGLALGCTSAALRAMGISFDMYRTMGFVHVCNHRTYAVPADNP